MSGNHTHQYVTKRTKVRYEIDSGTKYKVTYYYMECIAPGECGAEHKLEIERKAV